MRQNEYCLQAVVTYKIVLSQLVGFSSQTSFCKSGSVHNNQTRQADYCQRIAAIKIKHFLHLLNHIVQEHPRMASEESAQCLLLALLDPCLVAILQCCAADDQRSLFSAARAHSRLRQAAAVVLRSLTMVITDHQQADSMLLYLANHGMHVDHMSLRAVGKSFFAVPLRQLPPTLQLTSLELCNIYLQLQPGWGFQGVLGYAGVSALKRLQLEDCTVLDGGGAEGLAAALSLLPAGLEHFSIRGQLYNSSAVCLPTGVLGQLQQLTSLELSGKWMLLQGPDKAGLALQPPADLTRLVDLRLEGVRGMAGGLRVIASMLSGACHLTRLDVSSANFEVDTLAGKTHLQHLHLPHCKACGGPAGEAQLLSYLQHLQQLTHLDLKNVLQSSEASNPPAAAYAALTASSKLRHLNITGCTLPNGVWQHMFCAAKQLPHLRCLNVSGVRQGHGSSSIGPAPEGSRLVSCCPTLESLGVEELNHGTGLLNALQGLSGLHTLSVGDGAHTATSWQLLCQLTGLRSLSVTFLHHDCLKPFIDPKGPLLQLTQLQHLTALYYFGCFHKIRLTSEIPGSEPVWRKLLRLFPEIIVPGVSQQAGVASTCDRESTGSSGASCLRRIMSAPGNLNSSNS